MIKRRRKEKKITQLELRSKLGISSGYMADLENHPETCNPTLDIILGLSKHLKISPYKIFTYFIQTRKDTNDKKF